LIEWRKGAAPDKAGTIIPSSNPPPAAGQASMEEAWIARAPGDCVGRARRSGCGVPGIGGRQTLVTISGSAEASAAPRSARGG
jgi:hypothetical protein